MAVPEGRQNLILGRLSCYEAGAVHARRVRSVKISNNRILMQDVVEEEFQKGFRYICKSGGGRSSDRGFHSTWRAWRSSCPLSELAQSGQRQSSTDIGTDTEKNSEYSNRCSSPRPSPCYRAALRRKTFSGSFSQKKNVFCLAQSHPSFGSASWISKAYINQARTRRISTYARD